MKNGVLEVPVVFTLDIMSFKLLIYILNYYNVKDHFALSHGFDEMQFSSFDSVQQLTSYCVSFVGCNNYLLSNIKCIVSYRNIII